MCDFGLTSNLEMEHSTKNTDNKGIRELIDGIVKQVENMTCTKSVDVNESPIDDSEVPRCKLGHNKNSKLSTESSVEKSRHRCGNKKPRVRHRKHKWKPYHKLTADERRKLDERVSRRAYRARAKMSASGLTLAPYNTTQFLMDDHNIGEPDYESIHHESRNRDDCSCSDGYYSSPDDEEEFIQQQFSETYDRFHESFINEMTKFELVRELIRIEDEIESMEQTLKNSSEEKKSELDVEAEMEKIKVFEVEIKKLMHENHVLEERNEMLLSQLQNIKTK